MVVDTEILVVPQEYCPQAVIDWCNFDDIDGDHKNVLDRSEILARAKRHLSAVGWKFWYGWKNDRQELRYTSPSGKCHYSLRSACKACIRDGGATPASVSGGESCLVSEKAERFSRKIVTVSPRNATPNGESLVESPNSYSYPGSDSATSPSEPRNPRKRKIDFGSTEFPSASQLALEEFEKMFGFDSVVDVKDETMRSDIVDIAEVDHCSDQPSCSSKPKPVKRAGKVMADLMSSMRGKAKGKKRMNKRSVSVSDGNKRVRKIPNIPGISNSSRPRQNSRMSLGALIDSNVVNLGDRVSYRGKPSSGGVITREGILCNCCSVVFALTAFEEHVGSTNHRPAANIVLEDGRSLTDCKNQMKSGSNGKAVPAKTNGDNVACFDNSDDICSVCQYGGELVLCDRCPSAYHHACLGFETIPDGDWYCPSCCCGFCGNGKFEQDQEQEDSCVGNNGDTVACFQCERKFHLGCLRSRGVNTDKESGSSESLFCSRKCEDVCLGLSALVGKPIHVGGDGLTWTLLKSVEKDPKLKAALAVMHQCFEPARDPLTQRDMVEDVMFGRKSMLSRLNFTGFYVVVLEREGEMISVASVRIYGGKLAEVPLVATGFGHRRLGMCRALMDELENRMLDLGVERLTLPAASSVLQTWIDSFGFSKMSAAEKLELLPYNLLDFQDTSMCQKLLVKKATTSPVVEDLPTVADSNVDGYWPSEVGTTGSISAEHFRDCGLEGKAMVLDVAAKLIV